MNSKAAQLYGQIAEGISHDSVSALLSRALLLAKIIGDVPLENWARLEANGYLKENPALTEDIDVPEYRTVVGQYTDIYGRPLIIQDSRLAFVYQDRLRQGASELEAFVEKGESVSFHIPATFRLIEETLSLDVDLYAYTVAPSSIQAVLNGVRTELISRMSVISQSLAVPATDYQSATPTRRGARFHSYVEASSRQLLEGGHYRQAILDAFIGLSERVKELSLRYDLDGTALMQTVFSPKKPVLRVSDDDNEQMGYMWLFAGAVMGLRNPKAHSLIHKEDYDTTVEWLSFASSLFRVLDNCNINRTSTH